MPGFQGLSILEEAWPGQLQRVEMLRYTGHPIADIGVATIAAFCEKTGPAALTEKDRVKMA